MIESSRRYHWVDALRGVAALSIVVFHYHHFYLADAFDRPSIPPVSEFPYASVIGFLYSSFSANAVELFWLISGFVFSHVYLYRSTPAWQFGVARFARLYPVHFATLIYVAALQVFSINMLGHWQIYGNNDVRHFTLQLFMSSNWTNLSRGLSYNGPIWSVSLEIFVYAIFFVCLPALRRHKLFASLALLIFSWAMAYYNFADIPALNRQVFECAGYFFLGVFLYRASPGHSGLNSIIVTIMGLIVLILGLFFGLEDLAVSGLSASIVAVAARLDYIFPTAGFSLSVLGNISYSIYLVHVPIQMTALVIADLFFDGDRDFASSYFTLPVYLGASIALALVVHRKYEQPMGFLIRKRFS